MSANNKREDFTREDLLAVARNMGIKNALSIVDQVAAVVYNWGQYASEAGVKEGHKVKIAKNLHLGL
jgi:serine/threonine-protein kinase HipA